MPAPTPTVPTGQPVSGSTTTFEYALAYSAGAVVASPAFVQIPVTGTIDLQFSPQSSMYDAYVSSGSDAWSYAVKTGMQGTITVKTAAPLTDANVSPLVTAGLKSGNDAMILFRIKNADGSYFSGAAVIGVQNATPARGVQEVTFTGPTSGKIAFQAS